jgi:hypothetical protein
MAKVFLDSGDSWIIANDGADVFGAAGDEQAIINAGVTGVVLDSNVERADLAGNVADYTFQQQGNQLVAFSGGEAVMYLPVQEDGSQVVFADGSVEVTLDATGMQLGGSEVPSTEGPVVPTTIDDTVTSDAGDGGGAPVEGQTFMLTTDATSVTEGNAVTFTVTASEAVEADTTFKYQVSGVEVAGGTASLDDFTVGSGTLTMAAGETTATFTITPKDDGNAEGFEGFNVTLLDSDFAEVASSSNVVIEDGAESGQVFTLTKSSVSGTVDVIEGGDGDDTIQGLTYDSWENGDVIDGGDGVDTLNARFDASAAGGTSLTLNPNLTNVENVNLGIAAADNAGDNITVNTAGMTGLESIVVTNDYNSNNAAGDNAYTFNNVAAGVKAGASAGVAGAGPDITVAYKTTTGDESETFTVADAAAVNKLTMAGIETVTVEASGTKNVISDLTANAATTLNVSGDGAVSVVGLSNSSALKTLDASANTGGVTFGSSSDTIDNAITKVTGGTGNDTFHFTANQIASTDTIDGGDGTDAIELAGGSLGTAHANIANFETLVVSDTNSYDLSKLTSSTIETVKISAAATVSKLTDQKVDLTADAGTVTLQAKDADTSLTVELDNGTNKAADGVDITTLTTSNIDTLTINSNDSSSKLTGTNTNSAGAIQVENVNVAATAATALTFTGTKTKVIDGSESTGALTIDAASAYADATSKTGVSVTTGSGNDVITTTAQNDTVVAGAGNDKVNLSDGNDNIDLGAGDDQLVIASADFAKLTSDDTIVGGDGTDKVAITAANAGSYDLTGANSSKISNVTGVEQFGMAIDALTVSGNTATLSVDDATVSVANNDLTFFVSDATAAANAGAIAAFDASAVVLSNGAITLDASGFGSIVSYQGGNAAETITGGNVADVFAYATESYLSSSDALNGGDGADTLAFTGTGEKTITADQMTGVQSVGTINLDGVDGANSNTIKLTLDAATATAMAESNALAVNSINASGAVDDTGKITIDGSAVSSDVALTLTGGLGKDTIKGGAGNDVISGGTVGGTVGGSADTLTGGAGKDDFVLTKDATSVDTITDFDFGAKTGVTTVDQLKITGLSFTANDFDTVGKTSDGYSADVDVYVFNEATYADTSELDSALESLSTAVTGANKDLLLLWQDSLGTVHFSQAVGADGANNAADGGDEYTVTDLAKLSDLTVTGIADLVDTGDFIVA